MWLLWSRQRSRPTAAHAAKAATAAAMADASASAFTVSSIGTVPDYLRRRMRLVYRRMSEAIAEVRATAGSWIPGIGSEKLWMYKRFVRRGRQGSNLRP